MNVREDSYGNRKRLVFLTNLIARLEPASVLDVGCGTGDSLTHPLAQKFPGTKFVGIDMDARSVAFAREHSLLPNLQFLSNSEIDQDHQFDLVIASEVIEHVEAPDDFLAWLQERLRIEGTIFVSLPNGFGPFEFASFTKTLLTTTHLYTIIRAIYRTVTFWRSRGAGLHNGAAGEAVKETLAVSPHINFFTFRAIQQQFRAAGLRVEEYKARTFLCGFGFSNILRGNTILQWNANIADSLPPWLVSDWMFVLQPGEDRSVPHPGFRRGVLARLRKRLNERLVIQHSK